MNAKENFTQLSTVYQIIRTRREGGIPVCEWISGGDFVLNCFTLL